MGFVSEAQRRKIHELEKKGKVPAGTAARFEADTPTHRRLPERVKPKPKDPK